jgi:hypothetical protein
MAVLDTVADREAEWSATADALKATADRARTIVFALSIAGAILAALASQMGGGATDAATPVAQNPRAWVAIAAAISLAFATFFTQRLLGADRVTAWVRARAISEALKREAYKFATAAAPYNDANSATNEALLDQQRVTIEADGDDLDGKLVSATEPSAVPKAMLTLDEYRNLRVVGQAKTFYRPKAEQYKKAAARLRHAEFALALLATAITAVASVAGKSGPIFGIQLDFAAFTAVLTTLGAAVLAHVEAQRYDFLAMTYTATARRLEDRLTRPPASTSDFVNDCETVIANENSSWIAKWTK